MAKSIQEMLQAIVVAFGSSQTAAAQKLGVNKSQICRWLTGVIPNSDNIEKIKKLYAQVKSFKRLDEICV